jgi:hypothetical protein
VGWTRRRPPGQASLRCRGMYTRIRRTVWCNCVSRCGALAERCDRDAFAGVSWEAWRRHRRHGEVQVVGGMEMLAGAVSRCGAYGRQTGRPGAPSLGVAASPSAATSKCALGSGVIENQERRAALLRLAHCGGPTPGCEPAAVPQTAQSRRQCRVGAAAEAVRRLAHSFSTH